MSPERAIRLRRAKSFWSEGRFWQNIHQIQEVWSLVLRIFGGYRDTNAGTVVLTALRTVIRWPAVYCTGFWRAKYDRSNSFKTTAPSCYVLCEEIETVQRILIICPWFVSVIHEVDIEVMIPVALPCTHIKTNECILLSGEELNKGS